MLSSRPATQGLCCAWSPCPAGRVVRLGQGVGRGRLQCARSGGVPPAAEPLRLRSWRNKRALSPLRFRVDVSPSALGVAQTHLPCSWLWTVRARLLVPALLTQGMLELGTVIGDVRKERWRIRWVGTCGGGPRLMSRSDVLDGSHPSPVLPGDVAPHSVARHVLRRETVRGPGSPCPARRDDAAAAQPVLRMSGPDSTRHVPRPVRCLPLVLTW